MDSPGLDSAERLEIVRELADLRTIEKGAGFEKLAFKLFAYQFARCQPYRRLCESRGIHKPDAIVSVGAIPLAPTEAFKHYRMSCFAPIAGETVFETSGTTHGTAGKHFLPNTDTYLAGAMPWFARHLLPEGGSFRFLALTGSPGEMQRSSLVHMIEAAGHRFGIDGGVDYFYSHGRLEVDELTVAIRRATQSGERVMLLVTAFALVQWIDEARARGIRVELPAGSRVMETGGYKGRTRALARDELYRRASEALGIPTRAIVNEYGMTEMSSQFYDRTLTEPDLDEDEARIKLPSPWVRSFVLNPATMQPVGEGQIGVLGHIDLANVDSCAFLMTADLARRKGDGFELLGRAEEAEARGCSLDYEA